MLKIFLRTFYVLFQTSVSDCNMQKTDLLLRHIDSDFLVLRANTLCSFERYTEGIVTSWNVEGVLLFIRNINH